MFRQSERVFGKPLTAQPFFDVNCLHVRKPKFSPFWKDPDLKGGAECSLC